MLVNLDSANGRVEVNYLTGPGRAVGDLYLEITNQVIDSPVDGGPTQIQRLNLSELELPLDGYRDAVATLPVAFPTTTQGVPDAYLYGQIRFQPNRIVRETSAGFDSAGSLPSNLSPALLPARVRVFPGRVSTVALYVSSQTIQQSGGGFTFNRTDFDTLNEAQTAIDSNAIGKVPSRLSDFVRFPLTYVPAALRPQLSNVDGPIPDTTAGFVYFSGDNTALSSAASGANSVFQEVGDNADEIVTGFWDEGSSDNVFQGTYDLRGNLPSAPEGLPSSQIAIYGGYRDYNRVLTGGGSFEIIMLPNSAETYHFEGSASTGNLTGQLGDIVAIVRDARNRITNMYFGGVAFSGDDPTTVAVEDGYFNLYPIRYLGEDPTSIDPAQVLNGTVSGLTDRFGAATQSPSKVRHFTYTFTSAGLPTGFGNTGTATVFRS